MLLTDFLKMHRLILFTVACLFVQNTHSNPLYEEKFPKTSAKILLPPDPLEFAETAKLPMIHNNNYDMIVPDYKDHNAASSKHFQTFQDFYDRDMKNDSEMEMEETQFVQTNPVRAPQPLSQEERRVRQKLDHVAVKDEQKKILKLKKGSTKPRYGAAQWDQFDYDAYLGNPYKKYKKSYNR